MDRTYKQNVLKGAVKEGDSKRGGSKKADVICDSFSCMQCFVF